jgi:predicted nucleic acid-binding protein
VAIGSIPQLLHLAVKQDLSVYDTCYLQAALVSSLPLATNDKKLRAAAESCEVTTLVP